MKTKTSNLGYANSDPSEFPHGDVSTHPMLTRLQRMEEVERENEGYNPSAWLPRFERWISELVLGKPGHNKK